MTTTLVIFGISGDLARRKLVPALFTLHCKGRLPENLRLIGVSRSDFTDTMCRQHVWDGVQELADLAIRREEWEGFADRLFFARGDLSSPGSIDTLRSKLEELEADDTSANRLFYLAIAPSLFETAIANLGAAGLAQERGGWRRVVIEKPFGRDGASARALDQTIHSVFNEDQVYRIDHYLGKETVQNLLVFRFANAIFEPIWNRTYVDQVQITVSEQVDVSDRGAYYNESGVVRDMVQNHLLQLLTIVAMEPPNSMEADSLRNEKVKVLQGVRRWSTQEVALNMVAAQYKGYRDERGVAPDSRTPTYIALRLFIDNWRWQGVPFYLRSGKAMAAKSSEIAIQFRRPPHLLFDMSSDREQTANALGLCLQPNEGMHLRFQVKVPDAGMSTRPNAMEFHYESSFGAQAIPEAYERLLQDALQGDASLFMRADQVEQAWAIVQPVLEASELPDAPPMAEYERGSWGPEAADHLPDSWAINGSIFVVTTDDSVPEPRVFSTPTEAAQAGAEHVLAAASSAVDQRGRFVMALSGGGTPALLYRLLASSPYAQAMPWALIHLLWSDERWVEPDHADSNFAMARETLLTHVPIPEEQTHSIETTGLTPEESAVRYEREVRALFGRREPRLDLVLLGMGEDGHTASLFPGTVAVVEQRRLVAANHVPSLGAWRITMTLPLLNAARDILFLVTGPTKAQALRRVLRLQTSGDTLPAALVQPTDGRLTWLVDREAASLLSTPKE